MNRYFSQPEDWMETREGGWCISARVICYTYKMQRLRLLWDWRLGQAGFSACSCKMLTLSWLPYPLVERSFFTFLPSSPPQPTLPLSSAMPVGCIKSKWTTLFALVNKLAVHPDFTTILNETLMRVGLQQSSSILHLLSMFYKPSALQILDSFQISNTFF